MTPKNHHKPMPEKGKKKDYLTPLELHRAKQQQEQKTKMIHLHDAHRTCICVHPHADEQKVIKRYKKNYINQFDKQVKKMNDGFTELI
jgi:hypothetical protein